MKRYMSLDIGDRTVGIAVSDLLGLTAQGVETIRRKSLEEDLQRLDELIAEYEVDELVSGYPKNMNGTEGERCEIVKDFMAEVSKRHPDLPVHFWDERLSTVAAARSLIEADVSRKKRRKVIDKMAAVFILQGWLDRWNATAPEFAEQQKLWGRLARVRRMAQEFMIYGTLEDELRFAEPPPEGEVTLTHTWTGKTRARFPLPVVLGTVWKNQEGTATAIVAANWSDAPQTVRLRLPARGFAIRHVEGEEPPEYRENRGVGVAVLQPNSIAVLVARSDRLNASPAP